MPNADCQVNYYLSFVQCCTVRPYCTEIKFVLDQRSLMFYATTTKKCLPRIFVLPSFRQSHHRHKKPLRACSDTLSRHWHVLTPCHVTQINYVDRGVAARTPLQFPLLYHICAKHWIRGYRVQTRVQSREQQKCEQDDDPSPVLRHYQQL